MYIHIYIYIYIYIYIHTTTTCIEENVYHSADKKCLFKRSDLNKLYCQRLNKVGVEIKSCIHNNRPKNRILVHFLGISSFPDGREVLFAFDADIGKVLGDSIGINNDEDGFILAEAAKIKKKFFYFSYVVL